MFRFADGFEHYDTAAAGQKWTNASLVLGSKIHSDYGRFGQGFRLSMQAYVALTLDSQATWIVGFAFRSSSVTMAARTFLDLLDAGTVHVSLFLNADGTLSLRNGNGTTLATSTNALAANTWYYIEQKVTIADSGTYEVRVNGSSTGWIPSASGDTRNGARASANQIKLLGHTAAVDRDFDDFYLLDGQDGTASQGAANNDFWGDVTVETLMPDGNGAHSEWTGSDADQVDNYALVDESPANGDTDYVKSSTVGQVDTYSFGDLSTLNDVLAVQVNLQARKDDAGDRSLRLKCRVGGADHDGDSQALSTSYQFLRQVWGKNPATGALWQPSEVNAAEFGVEVTA
jgi:hypothetical protein